MDATWIMVADGCHARVWRREGADRWEAVQTLEHPASRLAGRALSADAPGRSFDSHGGARHAMEETDVKRQEAEVFARQLTDFLSAALRARRYEHLLLAA